MNAIARRRNKSVAVILVIVVMLLLWVVVVAPFVRQRVFKSETNAFFDRAFSTQIRLTRYHVEGSGLAFSDMTGWWDLALDR